MWVKDCQDHNNLKEFNCGEVLYSSNSSSSSSSRRLRHLLPKPTTSLIAKNRPPCCVVSSNYYCSCINNNNPIVFSMNHHQSSAGEDQESRKDEKHMEQIVSNSRWNPTPEQLMALEEMYRRGVRTPSAEEIKLIAAKLKQFGKIEGKNVFYWFQNHKARERQKRRRQPESTTSSSKFGNDHNYETLEGNHDKGFSCKNLEAHEESNRWIITSSKEPAASMQRAMGAESDLEYEGEMHGQEQQMSQRKMAKGGTKLMDLSCIASSNTDRLILNTINSATGEAAQQQKMLLRALNFSIFSSSSSSSSSLCSSSCSNADFIKNPEDATIDHQTLELFPLQNGGHCSNVTTTTTTTANGTDFKATTMNSSLPPNQFYQFL